MLIAYTNIGNNLKIAWLAFVATKDIVEIELSKEIGSQRAIGVVVKVAVVIQTCL